METICRAIAARRPLTQPTRPKRLETSMSIERVTSGTCASSAWRTIGASVPSTSSRIAEREGSARTSCSASARARAGGTRPSMPAMRRGRTLTLGVIGTLAGLFSGLFGVGGGIVIVPLLVLWLDYGEREPTGTSLAAITIIAAVAAGVQGLYGNVRVDDGLLLGVPAVVGVVAGTALQQRIPQRTISLLFAALLLATAIRVATQ